MKNNCERSLTSTSQTEYYMIFDLDHLGRNKIKCLDQIRSHVLKFHTLCVVFYTTCVNNTQCVKF